MLIATILACCIKFTSINITSLFFLRTYFTVILSSVLNILSQNSTFCLFQRGAWMQIFIVREE